MDVVSRKPGVRWGMVILGLFIAWIVGAFLAFGAITGGVILFAGQALYAVVSVTLVLGLVYFLVFWFLRKPVPDLALGILIGGCIVAVASGACGAILSGALNGPQ